MKTIRLLLLLFVAVFLLQGCHWFHHGHGHRHGYSSYGYSYDYDHRYGRRHHNNYYGGSIHFKVPYMDVIIH